MGWVKKLFRLQFCSCRNIVYIWQVALFTYLERWDFFCGVEFLFKRFWTKSYSKLVISRMICVKIYTDGLRSHSELLSFKYVGTNLKANQTLRPALNEIMSKALWTKSNSFLCVFTFKFFILCFFSNIWWNFRY